MNKPIIMIGSGGHASVLADTLLQQEYTLVATISPTKSNAEIFKYIQHFDCDEDILQFSPDEVKLVNGLGSMPEQNLRHKLFDYFSQLGYQFETVISRSAILSSYSSIATGAQVLTGAIIQTGAVIGSNSIVNSGAIVEHDCQIGLHNHIAPGATLCGGVRTGAHVHIGTGANIIQGVSIGKHCIVAAGATITTDMPENSIAYGYRSKIEKRT